MRSADADAYYGGIGYAVAGVPFGSSTGLDPITQGLDASTQGYAPYAHYGYGHHGLVYGKRSADADAYYGCIVYAVAGVPFGSSTGLDALTQGLDASTQGYAPYAYAAYPYAAYGHYYGKREAEAEADPALLYAGYAGYPYAAAYGAYPHGVAATYAGLVHSSHVGVCLNYLGASVPC